MRAQGRVGLVRGNAGERRDAGRASAAARRVRANRWAIDEAATQANLCADPRVLNAALGSHAGVRYLRMTSSININSIYSGSFVISAGRDIM